MSSLKEEDADPDPLKQFEAWFRQAREAGIDMPEAMAVASADPSGAPSLRMVLMKDYGPDGFVFFTGYGSRKGRELTANPRAALLFYWSSLGRQVRIEGAVRRASREQTERYVRSRPRGSQLSAMASPQSQVVGSRSELEAQVASLRDRYPDDAELPVPEQWGGFVVAGERFEFWQHRDDRLHDRLLYTRVAPGEPGWRVERLAP